MNKDNDKNKMNADEAPMNPETATPPGRPRPTAITQAMPTRILSKVPQPATINMDS